MGLGCVKNCFIFQGRLVGLGSVKKEKVVFFRFSNRATNRLSFKSDNTINVGRILNIKIGIGIRSYATTSSSNSNLISITTNQFNNERSLVLQTPNNYSLIIFNEEYKDYSLILFVPRTKNYSLMTLSDKPKNLSLITLSDKPKNYSLMTLSDKTKNYSLIVFNKYLIGGAVLRLLPLNIRIISGLYNIKVISLIKNNSNCVNKVKIYFYLLLWVSLAFLLLFILMKLHYIIKTEYLIPNPMLEDHDVFYDDLNTEPFAINSFSSILTLFIFLV